MHYPCVQPLQESNEADNRKRDEMAKQIADKRSEDKRLEAEAMPCVTPAAMHSFAKESVCWYANYVDNCMRARARTRVCALVRV